MSNFTFNDIKKDYIRITKLEMPTYAPVKRNTESVMGQVGERPVNTEVESKEIDMTIRVEANSKEKLQERKQDMAHWLMTDEPMPLVLDSEPDWTYYAYLDGDVEPDIRLGLFEVINLTFLCPDPLKYGKEKQAVQERELIWRDYVNQTWEDILDDD